MTRTLRQATNSAHQERYLARCAPDYDRPALGWLMHSWIENPSWDTLQTCLELVHRDWPGEGKRAYIDNTGEVVWTEP